MMGNLLLFAITSSTPPVNVASPGHPLEHLILWSVFAVVLTIMLVIDLGVISRKAHAVPIKEALIWSAIWIGVSLIFNVGVYFALGLESAQQFLAAYLLEKSLSVDNIFVFIMIFSYFGIAPMYQPRVLKWGIIGALVMRAIIIFVGYELVIHFEWIFYVFGAFVIYTGIKMVIHKEEKVAPEKNRVVRIFRKFMPITKEFHGEKFFTKTTKLVYATPLFIVLLVVESSDLMFAIDSIPAVLAISHDPFIVYTSNAFAILGLRALFFAVAGIITLFEYLKLGVSILLIYIGIKMILSVNIYKIPTTYSLLVIIAVLTISIVASIIHKEKKTQTIK